MHYHVEIKRTAEKDLKSLPKETALRIGKSLKNLAVNPRPPQSKRLQGSSHYRVRVGDYRIIYFIDDAARFVRITRIAHRKEAYR